MATKTFIRRGFSLPEMLVVVGIIAILLGLLMPTLNKARSAAAKVQCSANLADLGRAFQMYLSDSKGRVPQVNALPKREPAITKAPSVLAVFDKYVGGSTGVWRCPSDRPLNTGATFPAGAETYYDAYGLSYEYNSWMNAHHGGGTLSGALDVAKEPPIAVTPDKFRIFNDFSHFHGPAGRVGNMNFLFADWHVGDIGEALTANDLTPGT